MEYFPKREAHPKCTAAIHPIWPPNGSPTIGVCEFEPNGVCNLAEFKFNTPCIDNSHDGNENNEDKQEREGEGDQGREGDE